MRIWIVVADSAKARVLLSEKPRGWSVLHEFVHPQSRAKGDELYTDQPSKEDGRPPHEYEALPFARHLSAFLEKSYYQHLFEGLVLVAPPKFLGLMRQELAAPVLRRVHETIEKDFTELPARELEGRIELPQIPT